MTRVQEITAKVGRKFRTFGGGQDPQDNPIAKALKDGRYQFAAGVDVEEVVRFVMSLARQAPNRRKTRAR